MDADNVPDPDVYLTEADMRANEGRLSPTEFEGFITKLSLSATQGPAATESQQMAISESADPNSILCIKAGPGSGKTRTISRRIAALICSGIQPCEILVLSMTNRAVGALSDSLLPLLGQHTSSVNLFTFHSFCAMLVADYGHLHFSTPNRRFLGDYAWDKLNSLFSGKFIGFKGETVNGKITPKQLAKLLQMVKARQISIPEAAAANSISPEYLEALINYLDMNGIVRYPDLIADAQDLFKLSKLRPIARISNIKAVVVDEFQDMHPLLMLLVCSIMEYPSLLLPVTLESAPGDACSLLVETPSPRHLTLAGDPHQCIYDFLGADPSSFENITARFPWAKVSEISLADTFRLTPEILGAVTSTIVYPYLERNTGILLLKKPPTSKPVIYACESPSMEAKFVASEIVRLIATLGGLLHFADFAVLTRSNAELSVMKRVLTREFGIPVQLLTTPLLWTDSSLHLLLDVLRVLKGGPGSDLSLLAIISAIDTNRGANRRVSNIFNSASTHPDSMEDWLRGHLMRPPATRRVYKCESEQDVATQILAFFDAVNRERYALPTLETPAGIIALLLRIVRAASLLPALNTNPDSLHDRLAAFARALESSYRRYNLSGHSSFVEHFLQLLHDEPTPALDQDKVSLSTVHTAKGLEFPVVFMLGCAPLYSSLSQLPWHLLLTNFKLPKALEARVFYVGCTRSALLLYVGAPPRTFSSLLPQVNSFFSKTLPDLSKLTSGGMPLVSAIAQGLGRPVPSQKKINSGYDLYTRVCHTPLSLQTRQFHSLARGVVSVSRCALTHLR